MQATVRRAPPQTVAQRERQLENARRQEMVREETVRTLGREKVLESNMNREERLENKRFLRQQMAEQKEREMEETILRVRLYREYVYSVVVYQKYLTRLGELIIFEPWGENYHFSKLRTVENAVVMSNFLFLLQ